MVSKGKSLKKGSKVVKRSKSKGSKSPLHKFYNALFGGAVSPAKVKVAKKGSKVKGSKRKGTKSHSPHARKISKWNKHTKKVLNDKKLNHLSFAQKMKMASQTYKA